MTPILHGWFTVSSGQSIGGTVTYPTGGGAVDWTLAADDYAGFDELAAAIEDALDTAVGGAGTWAVSLVDYGADGFLVERVDDDDFDLTVGAHLVAFCGLDASYGARGDRTAAASSSAPPYQFAPRLPLAQMRVGYVHDRAFALNDAGSVVATARHTQMAYRGRVFVIEDDELAQWRSCLAQMRHGAPFRLYHDYPTDTAAWSWSNLDGRLDLVLRDPRTIESWLGLATTAGYFDLDAIVVE